MNVTASIVSQRDKALLTGDYNSYHAQSSRRIHAIRKRLGEATPRSRKFTPKQTITAQDVAKNVEYVQLLLASSERAWTSAMAMKSAQSAETTQKAMPGSTKRQIVSRLRKAIKYAENLVQVLKEQEITKASTVDILEAEAYSALLKGSVNFEKARWQPCLQQFSVVRVIYTSLESSTKSDIFKDLLSGTVDPSIRFAAYQLKFPRTKPISQIAVEQFPSSETTIRKDIESLNPQAFNTKVEPSVDSEVGLEDLPSTLTWRGRTVKIEDASISQTLGTALMREKDFISSFQSIENSKRDADTIAIAYDDVINARQDVVEATRIAITELTAEGVDQSDKRIQALQVTRTAVNYALIEWRIGRNRVLCGPSDGMLFEPQQNKLSTKRGKDGKHRVAKETKGRQLARLLEQVALYDAIIQSLDTIKELPGVAGDAAFVAELAGKRLYFQALRCLAIGRSHAAANNLPNALALYARALDLSRQPAASQAAKSADATSSQPLKLDITASQLTAFTKYLQGLVTQHQALLDLDRITVARKAERAKLWRPPIIERLDRFDDDVDLTNLVTYPPKLQPIPIKPLFFDLAWNSIDYPGRLPAGDEAVVAADVNGVPAQGKVEPKAMPEEKEQPQQPQPRRGWFGFGR